MLSVPRRLGSGNVASASGSGRSRRYRRRDAVRAPVVVAAVAAGRLHAVPRRLREDEVAATRVGRRVQLVPVHSETVALFQARPLALHQRRGRLEHALEHVAVGVVTVQVWTACIRSHKHRSSVQVNSCERGG